VSPENRNRFPGLNEHRFILFKFTQRIFYRFKRFPVTRSLADTPIYNKIFRPFRHLRIQVVIQHAERRFLFPSFTFDFQTFFSSNFSRHDYTPYLIALSAKLTFSISLLKFRSLSIKSATILYSSNFSRVFGDSFSFPFSSTAVSAISSSTASTFLILSMISLACLAPIVPMDT